MATTQADTTRMAIKARNTAVKMLIDKYPDEFATFYGDAREAVGLPRVKPSDDIQKLRARVKTQQERLLKLQAELLKAESNG